MSCLICLRDIHQDDDTGENALKKIRIATLRKIFAPKNQSEFDDDDDEMCDVCTNCYPLLARMEEIKNQISLLEEEMGSKVGQMQATMFDTSSQLENYGDDRKKIIRIRNMLLPVSGANAEEYDEHFVSDEVEVKIEHDADDQFLGDDGDNSYLQAMTVEKADEEETNDLHYDEDGDDSAFCITPSILKKRSRGRPKKTAKEKTKTPRTKRKREDNSPSLHEESANLTKISTRCSPRIKTQTEKTLVVSLKRIKPSIKKSPPTPKSGSEEEDTNSDRGHNELWTPKIEPDDIPTSSDDESDDSEHKPDIVRPHKCTFCPKAFSTESALRRHGDTCHIVPCNAPSCTARFRTVTARNAHLKQDHDGRAPLHCQICNRGFNSGGTLAAHMVIRHEKGEKKFFCAKCSKGFVLEENYARHVKLHEVEESKPLVCYLCDDRFENEARLEKHLQTLSHFNPFKCNLCEKRCNTNRALERHLRGHAKAKLEKCPHCDVPLADKISLEFHIARVHTSGPAPYICEICGRGFYLEYDLKLHIDRQHNNKLRDKCDICSETFKHASSLQAHVIKVHGGDPYVCDECGAKITSRDGLKRHKKIHEGTKNHKCEICGYSFIRPQQLRNHLASHTAERPFPCPHCEKPFKTRSNLEAHVRNIHTPGYVTPTPYKCPHCGKGCQTPFFLKGHIRQAHTGERPFVCYQCGKGFAVKSALTLHLKGAHGVALEVKKDRLPRSKKDVVQGGDDEEEVDS